MSPQSSAHEGQNGAGRRLGEQLAGEHWTNEPADGDWQEDDDWPGDRDWPANGGSPGGDGPGCGVIARRGARRL
jgi:hypothetical protein